MDTGTREVHSMILLLTQAVFYSETRGNKNNTVKTQNIRLIIVLLDAESFMGLLDCTLSGLIWTAAIKMVLLEGKRK